MKQVLKLLGISAIGLAVMGAASAQDVRDYTWRNDLNNHGWKIGIPKDSIPGRPQRLATSAQKWVTIQVNRVAQIDNLDQGDALGADRADFYAMIWVDGQVYKSRNFSHDDGDPNWTLRVPVSGDVASIRVRLMDDDGGFEERDDHVDINPAGHAKDLILNFNAATGQISGDATGTAGSWIESSGGGDDDRGRIGFKIG